MATPDETHVADNAPEEPNPVVPDPDVGEEGEDSDDYEENFEGDDDEEEDEDEVAPQTQSGLTALLLANPNASVEEEEEEDEDEDDDDEYVEGPSTEVPAPSASKKRGIEDVAPEDEADTNGEAKKVKA